MKRWHWIALSALAVWFLIVLPSLWAGVYSGSRSEPLAWVEPGGTEVRGNVLVCEYYRWRSGFFDWDTAHEEIFFPGPKRDLLLPDGHGTFLKVMPEAVGVTRCPVYGFWTWWGKYFGITG